MEHKNISGSQSRLNQKTFDVNICLLYVYLHVRDLSGAQSRTFSDYRTAYGNELSKNLNFLNVRNFKNFYYVQKSFKYRGGERYNTRDLNC